VSEVPAPAWLDELTRARARAEMLSSASFEGILIHRDGVILDANARLSEILGYGRDELMGLDVLQRCVAPEDIPAVRARMTTQFEGASIVTGVRKDGSRFRAELLSKEGRLGGEDVRVVAVRDVTERERTQTLLRESEGRFRDLTLAVFDFTIFTRDGIVVDVSPSVERVLGFKRQDAIGRPVLDFTAPTSIPDAAGIMRARQLGTFELSGVNVDGEIVPLQCTIVESTLDGQPVRVGGIRDLRPVRQLEAERRALAQQLERAQRLDSLGALAGGIAHDFNNLLAGVLGNADHLRERLAGSEDAEAAQAIFTAAQRAADLTRQMLAYAGQRDLGRRAPVDVGELVHELRTLLGATLSKKAHVELAIERGCVVLGDRATLTQVLMNLLTNASDALEGAPGRIDVRVRRAREVDARWDQAHGATVGPGAWVLIEVEDPGVGMEEATRNRVFEPFFSTKEKGHGLGLAACLGIVSAHGGAVLVESQPGKGSRFSVLLPEAVAPAQGAPAAKVPASGAPCRVLVIDDEPLVRTQLRRLLERRGYSVDEASDGRTGLAALEATRPDLLILDMTMPDLDGAEILRRVRASGSRVPVIVSSGYLDATIERNLPRDAFQVFLAKPYGIVELMTAVQRALATR
jgi:two-component system cell cycle sensor histidine kinase/response regulator CckA